MSKSPANLESTITRAKQSLRDNILEIEHRTDLSEDDKVERIIKIFSATCAGIAIQPIPFADFFILTPLQAYMGSRIAAIRGVPVSEEHAARIVKELLGVVGLGLVGQQLIIGAYKTFIPFLGAVTTIPMVYGVTYAIGKLMDSYFVNRRRGVQCDPEMLKSLWSQTLKTGKAEGLRRQNDIKQGAKPVVGEEA